MNHEDILYLLSFFSKKREELISPFLDKACEWIGPTFKYERNQAAFDLVRESYVTLWIDRHFIQLNNDDVSDEIRNKALKMISTLLNAEESYIGDSQIKHSLLNTKIKVIQKLLLCEKESADKLNELKYAYDKDKALFEREFLKFEK